MRLIVDHFGDDLEIFAGEFAVDRSIRTLGPSDLPINTLSTHSFFGGRVFLQAIPLLTYVQAPVLVADLNPRVIHLWPILLVRRLLKRSTVLWGAAWPRKGRESRTTGVRMAMVRLSSGVIIYTQRQAHELRAAVPNVKVDAAPNSLYPSAEFGFIPGERRTKFVYVGRIVAEKKVALLLRAFAKMHSEHSDASLTIVGDGPAMREMQDIVDRLDLSGSVDFLGHIDDVEALRDIYSSCIASVSPGYVGLSATQSFSFGVPMIVADREPHSPEIEAVIPGFNAIMFKSDSVDALAEAMQMVFADRSSWEQRGSAIAEECQRTYSAEAMAAGVIRAVDRADGNSCAVR